MCKYMPVLKEKIILWIIVNASNKNLALFRNAFLHKRSSLLHKDIGFHVCIFIVCETVVGFTECMGCIS